jgi:murein DD-endopeptidase MepM/ murein hydrolase activator NlpD
LSSNEAFQRIGDTAVGDKLATTRLGRPGRSKAGAPARGGIRPRLFYAIFTALFATNVLTLLALLLSPDIASLFNGQTAATLSAYQDRLTQLRLEVDRLHSRQYARTGDINLQLQELAQQQEVLAEQHQYVKALADKAAELGIGAVAPAPVPAPRPGPAQPATAAAALPASATLSSDAGEAAIEEAGHQVRRMMDDSRTALAAISAEADASTDEILASLGEVGIKPDLSGANGAGSDADGVGGPLLPPRQVPDGESLIDEANAVGAALARFKDARAAIADAPVHMPLAGQSRVSSGFGNRRDPFTGRLAFHPGIDFPWPSGTLVMSAGAGKVAYVGQINGYGNVIDIDHGDGIVTRYGHLSSFIATKGEIVETGTPIARVGSTGRSTGPHLHFEVRRNDSPVNPNAFLAVGRRLAHFLHPTSVAAAPPDEDDDTPGDADGQDGTDSVG